MQCNRCSQSIPQNALRCNNCKQTTTYTLGRKSMPDFDQYGQPVFELHPNEHKANVRDKYIKNLPEYKEMVRIKKDEFKKALKVMLYIFLAIPMWVLLFIASLFLFDNILVGFGFMMILFFVFLGFSIFFFVKKTKSNKHNEDYIKQMELHHNPLHFYVSDNAIGYSLLDHIVENDKATRRYYAFYEIDKRNIQRIGYDSRYGEYVFLLCRPVYFHYNFEPKIEFRIADVFDDHILPNVFGYDLPPRHIPF